MAESAGRHSLFHSNNEDYCMSGGKTSGVDDEFKENFEVFRKGMKCFLS